MLDAVGDGTTRFKDTARPDHGNPNNLSGALIAAVMDFAVVTSILTRLNPDQQAVTVDLHTSFLRSTPADGSVLTVRGQTIHMGANIAFAEGTLENEIGELIAKATSTSRVLPTRRTDHDSVPAP